MKKILIVDDLKAILLTLEALLIKEGYFVYSCLNAEDALHRFSAEHFDLIITDAIMPMGANGYTFISTVRAGQRNREVPIIMLTGKREKSDIEKALSAGANDYVVKPIDPDIVLTKVRQLVTKTDVLSTFVSAPIQAAAMINIQTTLTSISEVEVKFSTNSPLPAGQLYRLTSEFFETLDMEVVTSRILACDFNSDTNNYYVTAQFVGLTDKELSKIRLWIRKKLSNI